LPAATRGWSDITALYVQQFGVPPPEKLGSQSS